MPMDPMWLGQVCNISDANYSSCACAYANSTLFNATCFSEFVCGYNLNGEDTGFCAGNGVCSFSTGDCNCDSNWGGDECDIRYERFFANDVLMTGMMVWGILGVIVTLSLLVWVHKYRSVPEVKAMSITFTQIFLVGCAILLCAPISQSVPYNNVSCVLIEWFSFLGITLILGSAGVKAYRISSIFNRQTFSPSDLTDKKLLKYLAVLLAICFFLLCLYTLLNFVEGGSYDRYLADDVTKERRCSSEFWAMFAYSLLSAFVMVLLLAVLKYGNDSRSAAGLFKETKCIYIGSNVGTILFITFIVFILFTTNYEFQIGLRGYSTLILITFVETLLFYPKFKAVYKKVPTNADGFNEAEVNLAKQYQLNLKERSSKELLLILNTLIDEMHSRAKLKILKVELSDVHINKADELVRILKDILVTREAKSKKKLMKKKKKGGSSGHVSMDSPSGNHFAVDSGDDNEFNQMDLAENGKGNGGSSSSTAASEADEFAGADAGNAAEEEVAGDGDGNE